MKKPAALFLTATIASPVEAASRDNSYYRPGFVNPNLDKHPLYHKNAKNVLENLSSFKALYVRYENCAWAYYGNPYANRYNDEENYGWDGNGGGDDGGDGNGEGGGEIQVRGCGYNSGGGGDYGGESSHWYMGRVPCFRAQAAYSLYGIPADGSIGDDKKCRKATYINSFFTTMGVEAFAAPLGVDTTYGNAYCTMIPPEDGDVVINDDDDDYYHDYKYNFQAFTSYGTGCSRGKFVTDSYQGAFCDGNGYEKTTGTLDDFNKALNELDCVQIYDAETSGYAFNNNGNDDEQTYTDNNGYVFYYDNKDYTELADTPVAMLEYSIACDVDQYPDSCPDPHGLLRKYKTALKRALSLTDFVQGKSVGEKALNAVTGFLFFFAFLFVVAAIRKRRRMAFKPKIDSIHVELVGRASSAPATSLPKKKRSRSRSLSRKRTGERKAGVAESEPESLHSRQPSAISMAAASVVASVASVKEAMSPSKAPADTASGASPAKESSSKAAGDDDATSYYAPGDCGVLVHKMKLDGTTSGGEVNSAQGGSTRSSKAKSKKKAGLFGRFRKR